MMKALCFIAVPVLFAYAGISLFGVLWFSQNYGSRYLVISALVMVAPVAWLFAKNTQNKNAIRTYRFSSFISLIAIFLLWRKAGNFEFSLFHLAPIASALVLINDLFSEKKEKT